MSQLLDPQDFLKRLMRNEVSEAELMNLVTAGHALTERRKNAARRRAVEINTELVELRERLDELHRDADRQGYSGVRATAIIETAQINLKTQMLVAELNRLLTLVPGLHYEVLNAIADEYDERDAKTASSADPTQAPTHVHLPDDADPAAVAEAIRSALGGKDAPTPLVGQVNAGVYINLGDADPQAAADAINAFLKGGEVKK